MIAELVLQMASLKSQISQLRQVVSGSPAFVEGWATPKDAAAALKNEGVKGQRHLQRCGWRMLLKRGALQRHFKHLG